MENVAHKVRLLLSYRRRRRPMSMSLPRPNDSFFSPLLYRFPMIYQLNNGADQLNYLIAMRMGREKFMNENKIKTGDASEEEKPRLKLT
jgi:hypothetical protein